MTPLLLQDLVTENTDKSVILTLGINSFYHTIRSAGGQKHLLFSQTEKYLVRKKNIKVTQSTIPEYLVYKTSTSLQNRKNRKKENFIYFTSFSKGTTSLRFGAFSFGLVRPGIWTHFWGRDAVLRNTAVLSTLIESKLECCSIAQYRITTLKVSSYILYYMNSLLGSWCSTAQYCSTEYSDQI